MCELFCRIQSLWHVWRRLKPSLPTRNTKESHAMSTLRCIFLLCNYVVWSVKAWHRMLKIGFSLNLQELNRSGTLAEIGLQGWSTFIAQEWQFGGHYTSRNAWIALNWENIISLYSAIGQGSVGDSIQLPGYGGCNIRLFLHGKSVPVLGHSSGRFFSCSQHAGVVKTHVFVF